MSNNAHTTPTRLSGIAIGLPLLLLALAAFALVAKGSIAAADSIPSGERSFQQSTLEPVYNAAQDGQIGYILTPNNAPPNAAPAAWAPYYVVVYPVGTTAAATLNCMHTPVENCPSHGNGAAAAAQKFEPSVYGDGVLGHDHVMDFPGGDDFNIAWEPILVLFTSKTAANEHLLTDDQIAAAVARGDAIEVPRPAGTFNCAVVSAAVWNLAIPVV